MSKQDLSKIVNELLDGVGTLSKSETIVGAPQQAGGATVIPVHRLKVAFGAGMTHAGTHGSRVDGDSGAHGVGGAVELDPIAAIAVGADGHAHLLTVQGDSGTIWSRLLGDVPDLLTRLAHSLGERAVSELDARVQRQLPQGSGAADAEAPEGDASS